MLISEMKFMTNFYSSRFQVNSQAIHGRSSAIMLYAENMTTKNNRIDLGILLLNQAYLCEKVITDVAVHLQTIYRHFIDGHLRFCCMLETRTENNKSFKPRNQS